MDHRDGGRLNFEATRCAYYVVRQEQSIGSRTQNHGCHIPRLAI
jgi:hypothetical protein